jgi:hypothetical protein
MKPGGFCSAVRPLEDSHKRQNNYLSAALLIGRFMPMHLPRRSSRGRSTNDRAPQSDVWNMLRFIPTAARLWWLPSALCAAIGCGHPSDSDAVRLRDALDAEGNRLRLLAEEAGTVEMVPSIAPYWVALVPDNGSSNLDPALPFTRSEYERACPSESPGARILVGDNRGIRCVISTALRTDEVQVVSKTKGDSVEIDLFRGTEGASMAALH